MDLRMPGIGGVKARRRIAAEDAPPVVLVLTMVEDEAVSRTVAPTLADTSSRAPTPRLRRSPCPCRPTAGSR